MRFLPNTKRKNIIFADLNSALGFFVCLVLCAVTVCALGGYARQILLPEVSKNLITAVAVFAVALTAVTYLFSAEWIVYPALGITCMGGLVLTAIPVVDAVKEKLHIISVQIYMYEPDYALPYFSNHGFGLSVVTALMVMIIGVVMTHFIVRCKVLVPIILTSALTMGIFIALERNDGVFFYVIIICLIAMLCVAVQAKAGKAMGEKLPVTKLGAKTIAFLMAAALVLLPVAGNESFSQSVIDIFSQLTGIQPPGASPGGYGDASSDISMDGFEQFLDDLEERQSKTDLEDINFQEVLLYIVSGADDDEDIFFRRRIYDKYSDSTWELDSAVADDLTDNAMETLASLHFKTKFPRWVYTRLTVSAMQKPLYIPVATGTVKIDNTAIDTFFDTDGDKINEKYPAYGMYTYRFLDLKEEAERFEFLKGYATDDPFMDEDINSGVLPVSGDDILDQELRALAEKIILRYTEYPTIGDWLASESSTIDAVQAVQTYLAETKYYTMNPQMSDRYVNYDHTKDSIYNFLFNTGEGYCVQFSSSAVLLLRSLGINARYVTGYVSRSSDQDGLRYIYDSSSHAWCEVNLTGIGWVPFEMTYGAMINSIDSEGPILDTPIYADPDASDISEPDVSDESSADESSDTESSIDESSDTESSESGVLSEGESGSEATGGTKNKKAVIYCVCAAICVIIITLVVAIIYRRNEKRRKKVYDERVSCSMGVGDPTEELLKLHTQHIALLELLCYIPIKAEKHSEYAERIRRSEPDMPNPKTAMDIFRKAEFGGKPTKEELVTAGKHILALNDYVYARISGFKKKRAYFKGIITKPVPKRRNKK